jgi:ATP-dependent phosphofructokinase / diphosphate-dependent phosphofructokinase
MGYPVQAIHVPKTVDNDLPITDNCPGFGSVAKYIATSTLEASFDVRSMCATSTKIFVIEVMGRHAGWIAAAGALVADQNIPVITLFPEVEFDQERFLAAVQAKVEQHGYCTIVRLRGLPLARTAASWPSRAPATPSAMPSSAARPRWWPT